MGRYLDLSDLVQGHPLSQIELAMYADFEKVLEEIGNFGCLFSNSSHCDEIIPEMRCLSCRARIAWNEGNRMYIEARNSLTTTTPEADLDGSSSG